MSAHPRKILALANQRPAVPVTAPAVIRHFLYRIPSEINPRYQQHGRERPAFWANILYRVNHVIERYKQSFGCITKERFWIKRETQILHRDIEPFEYMASDTMFIVLQKPNTEHSKIHLRVEFFLETFSVTIIADNIPPESELNKDIVTLLACKDDISIKKIYESTAPSSLMGTINARSYLNQYPPGIDSRIVDPLLESLLQKHIPAFEEPFIEIRGLVLPAIPGTSFIEVGQESLEDDVPPKDQLTPNVRAFLTENCDLIRKFVCADWQSDQTLKVGPEGWTDAELLSAEAVVCGMLDGRALYASPLSMAPTTRSLVNYLVAYDGNSPAQLGRFIRRMHVLAELRLSALIEFDRDKSDATGKPLEVPKNLFQASQEIRRIGNELTLLEQKKRQYAIVEKHGEIYDNNIGRDDYTFNSILSSYFNINKCSDDGIIFRVERSRYYSEAFRSRIDDLRIVRLEGWQPYDEFVRRYLFQIYDHISSVGTRYQALGARIDRWQSLRAGAEIAKQSASSRKLLERAEDIGILAGIYYGYSGLEHWSEHALKTYLGNEIYRQILEQSNTIATIIIVVLIMDTVLFSRKIRKLILFMISRWHHLLDISLDRIFTWFRERLKMIYGVKPPTRAE